MTDAQSPLTDPEYLFCPRCGGRLGRKRIKRGDPERLVCQACEFVFFLDPKVAVGTILEREGRIILGRRSIEPSYGLWVFPGGFVDRGEAVREAARREALEEMNVHVEVAELIDVYSYPDVPVVVIVYRADILGGQLSAADECLEVREFSPSQIPWDELAFESTRDALKEYVRRYLPDDDRRRS